MQVLYISLRSKHVSNKTYLFGFIFFPFVTKSSYSFFHSSVEYPVPLWFSAMGFVIALQLPRSIHTKDPFTFRQMSPAAQGSFSAHSSISRNNFYDICQEIKFIYCDWWYRLPRSILVDRGWERIFRINNCNNKYR